MSDTAPAKPDTGDRLAKVIARSGLCSRRDAEVWITEGRVVVNGKKVLTPAFNVTDRDKIMVDGAPLAARQGTRVWLYHKPAGLVVTEKDPEGRETIFQHLETHGLPRVVTVGRLDINTEGLLLLTNDGGLKRVLELPATGWLRRYRVRAHGTVTQAALDKLKDGIEIDGIKYGSIEATLEREQGANVWLVLALREGKNREVKNVLGALGLEVNRLIRISYGPFQLGDIPVGAVETVKAKMLRDQLGKKLADAADVDFDSDMPAEANALVGKPTRDRLTGRGTNTVEIARQRFRFTDGAEKTEEEIRAERPRQDRPGRFDSRKPVAKREEARDEYAPPPRHIHFDEDGRAPEEFVAKRNTRIVKRPDRDDQSAATFGKAAPRPAGGKKPFGDKKSFGDKKPFGDKKSFGDKKPYEKKSFGDKPRGPRREDDRGGRPPQGREFTGTPRGPRRSGAERPAREFTPRLRPDSERGEGAAFKGEAKRPGRNFSDKPARFRPEGGRSSAQRDERPARGERATRPGRDEFGSEAKTYGKPRMRADGKPMPKRDGAAPARGPRPGGKPGGFGGKPGGRPSGGAGRPSGGRPSGGAGRPSGPRRPKA
jgi:23S rRNA pseudouridine2605 synthase